MLTLPMVTKSSQRSSDRIGRFQRREQVMKEQSGMDETKLRSRSIWKEFVGGGGCTRGIGKRKATGDETGS
jgi:hypothetical protein